MTNPTGIQINTTLRLLISSSFTTSRARKKQAVRIRACTPLIRGKCLERNEICRAGGKAEAAIFRVDGFLAPDLRLGPGSYFFVLPLPTATFDFLFRRTYARAFHHLDKLSEEIVTIVGTG